MHACCAARPTGPAFRMDVELGAASAESVSNALAKGTLGHQAAGDV